MPTKSALEIYDSSDRTLIRDYYALLGSLGPRGQLAMLLLRAQRNQERSKTAAARPQTNHGDYLRMRRNYTLFAIFELTKFCHEAKVPGVKIRNYKYGIRVTIPRFAVLRFRETNGDWTGDEANLLPICEYCDTLVRRDGDALTTRTLFSGLTTQ